LARPGTRGRRAHVGDTRATRDLLTFTFGFGMIGEMFMVGE
jgi:hypothetical protein